MMWLRTASQADIAAIHELLVETWHATYDDFLGPERVNQITAQWHSPASIRTYLAEPLSEYVVADDGKQICGVAYAKQTGAEIILHQLYVRPQFQNKGAGGQLLAEIESAFPDARSIKLAVFEKNSHTIQFYTRHGYKITGKPVQFFSFADINEITMEKNLSN